MWMTDWEIAQSYRKAEKKNAQIRIIAELNACDVLSVIQALNRQGIRLDKKTPKAKRVVKGVGRPKCDKEIRDKPQEYKNAMMVLLSRYKKAELARMTGLCDVMIAQYAMGERRPSEETFEKMLRNLNMTRKQFFNLGKEIRQ